jgi:MFS family permease
MTALGMTARGRARPIWLVVTVLSSAGMIGALQFVLLVPMLGVLPGILSISPADTTWLVTATLLSGAVTMPLFTRLADMYGKRLISLVSLGCVVAGSGLAFVSDELWLLLASRALVGMSIALTPIGIAMMREVLPPERLNMSIALMSMTMGLGLGFGLPLGGWLYEAFGWHSPFAFSLIVAAVQMAILPLVVRESSTRVSGRFDLLGAFLLTISLTALLLAIGRGGEWGWVSLPTLGMVALAAVMVAAWLIWEHRVETPIVDLRTSRTRPILLTNVGGFFLGIGTFGNMMVTTAQLQVPISSPNGFGISIADSGILMLPAGIAIAVFAPIAGRTIDRLGPRLVLIAGSLLMTVAYATRIILVTEVWQVILGAVLTQVGLAFCLAAAPVIITRYAPLDQIASANGVNNLVRNTGSTIMAAITAAAFAIVVTSPTGIVHPSPVAFILVFAVCGLCSFLSAIFTLWVPDDRPSRSNSNAPWKVS